MLVRGAPPSSPPLLLGFTASCYANLNRGRPGTTADGLFPAVASPATRVAARAGAAPPLARPEASSDGEEGATLCNAASNDEDVVGAGMEG